MTYEELNKKLKAIEREEDAFVLKCGRKELALKKKYIKEHAPLELKDYQRIIVKLKGKRNYSIDAIFCGWWISPKGELRPCLWNREYSQEDEILSIELHKCQPEGDCKKCLLYKDGLCYKAGGKNLGRGYATHKVKDGDLICPRYEEIIEGGLWGKMNIWPHKFYPNVTFVYDEKFRKKYHIYEGRAWRYFTEHSEEEIENYYSFEPIDYSDEK